MSCLREWKERLQIMLLIATACLGGATETIPGRRTAGPFRR
jgi:hypothetical protein